MSRPAMRASSIQNELVHHQPNLIAALAATTLILLLQSERVFVPTMIFVVDQSNRQQLVRNAAVVFLAVSLAGLWLTATSLRTTALLSVGLATASRLFVQFSADPQSRWVVAAVGVMASGWLLIVLALTDRQALALGIPVGFWLDLVLRAFYDTIDLAYMTSAGKNVLTLVIVVVALLLVWVVAWPAAVNEPGWRSTLTLTGLGLGVTTFALAGGNLGLASVTTDNALRDSFWLLSIGPLLAIALWLTPPHDRLMTLVGGKQGAPLAIGVLVLGGIGAVGLWSQVESNWAAGLSLALYSGASTYLAMIATAGPKGLRRHAGPWRTTVAVTLGLLLHAALVFLYFAESGSLIFVLLAYAALAAASLPAFFTPAVMPEYRQPTRLQRAVLIGVVLLPWLVLAGRDDTGHVSAEIGPELTIVTYNIQNGFSRDNVWDLEATAQTIEMLEPDIVLLQESGRGWFAMGWADQVWWLSNRLGMDVVFGPASKDDLWGNAILSSAPLQNPELLKFSSTENLNRSVISVEVVTSSGPVWVASTHLDNPTGAGTVRMEQTTQLLDHWGGTSPAVMGGDFNAQPDSDVIEAVVSAGFVDAAAAAGAPQTTSESGNRIDYIFATADLTVLEATAPDVWTSDHRPVRVVVALPGP